MQSRMPIVVALVVAVAAIILTNLYIEQIRRESEPATSTVMVASRDLTPGTILAKEDIAFAVRYTQALPRFNVPYNENTLYLGQELTIAVTKDDYILSTYFGGGAPGERKLSQKVDAKLNQRAMTIPVDNEQGLEGSILPGDRIDLLLSYQTAVPTEAVAARPPAGAAAAPPRRAEFVTASLLENVYVLTTGRYGSASETQGRYRSLTILVSPVEAKLLIWAMNLGKLSVLLRNPKDLQATDRAVASGNTDDLKGLGQVRLNIPEVVAKNRASGGQ
ncbi:MAG: Flp pilus assembly protein CpaB [Deltaproteobacteria bacterium]|nr:Flp pilus assembly protein CpaB [Deltaproteobacteria bacterium]